VFAGETVPGGGCSAGTANHVAARLDAHSPVLHKNHNGRVAHECIVDPRALKDRCGVSIDDIAKRLIDYGFHAPTMSFPVAGTLMIEPTESESKFEIDRVCDAMIAIRHEIAEVESGRFAIEASPLRHAPHTVHDLVDAEWNRAYTREEAVFPAGVSRNDKYWAPVGRAAIRGRSGTPTIPGAIRDTHDPAPERGGDPGQPRSCAVAGGPSSRVIAFNCLFFRLFPTSNLIHPRGHTVGLTVVFHHEAMQIRHVVWDLQCSNDVCCRSSAQPSTAVRSSV
jgi:hypothetical protein